MRTRKNVLDIVFAFLTIVFLGGGGMLMQSEPSSVIQKATGAICWLVGTLIVGYITSKRTI